MRTVEEAVLGTTDEELMALVQGGDREAFGELVRRHQGRLWNVAVRYVGHPEDAADLVQATFLGLLETSHRYRPSGPLSAFLYRILVNRCLNHRASHKPLLLEDLPDRPDPETGDPLLAAERDRVVARAVAALPDKQRMVVVLRHHEGLSYTEIAQATGLSVKAVERHLARAREDLRGKLEGWA